MTINDKNKIEKFVIAIREYCEHCKDYKQIDQATAIKAECINKEIDRELEVLNTLFSDKDTPEETKNKGLEDLKIDIEVLITELEALHQPSKFLRFFGIKAAKILRRLKPEKRRL
jgi:hypothetical protein